MLGRWVRTDIYVSENWIVIRENNIRIGYDRVKSSVGKSYDKIEGTNMFVSRNFNLLSEIATDKKVKKLDCLSIDDVINMHIEVSSDEEFVRGDGGGCMVEK